MKVLIFGQNKDEIKPLVTKAGFDITTQPQQADFVIAYGGDGTFIRAENEFPGICKIILRGSRVCKKCPPFSNEEILQKIAKGQYKTEDLIKLEAKAKNKTTTAVNEINVHNADPRHGIRYRIAIDERAQGPEIIGDGIVVATPFGSTGYYRSITDSFFEVGIGIAFNSSTEQADHMVISKNSQIKMKITRGPATVYTDNQKEIIELSDGDEVVIGKSRKSAKIVSLV